VFDSESVLVARNASSDQVHPDTGGIVLIATTHDSVLDNRLSGNNLGIDAESSTTASVIAGNEVRGGGDGIGLLDSDGLSPQCVGVSCA
jgi:parallel beta-helix repeat protein